MSIISVVFVLFICALILVYYAVGRVAGKGQWVVLLVGSLAFYWLQGTWLTMLVLVLVAAVTWLGSLAFARLDGQAKERRKATRDRAERKRIKQSFARRKRVVLVATLVASLGILSYFKYWNVLLNYVGMADSPTSLGILLPLGISFYTMQSVGYLIDTYNQKCEAERNFARHLLFVSYFPQVIQGPINPYETLGPQLCARHAFSVEGTRRGLLRFGYGLLKKVCIANVLGGTVTKLLASLTNPAMPGSIAVYGVLLYSIQMYADFSGGIDMVEGVSELFGIQMAPNFRQPYFSTSLSVFWQRWHMSLGVWVRSYVFYPLAVTKPFRQFGRWGTKRLGRTVGRTLPACVANVIVFLIVGAWHGIELHYLAWGLFNGVVIAVSDLLSPVFDKVCGVLRINRKSGPYLVFAMLRTFAVVNVARYFDCITDLSVALSALRRSVLEFHASMFASVIPSTGISYQPYYGVPPIVLVACALVFVVSVACERGADVRACIMGWNVVPRFALYVGIGAMIAISFGLETVSGGTFLYANF